MDDIAALGDELLRLTRRRAVVYDDALLENSAFRILWVLSDGTPRTLRTLAGDLELEQSTVNRQVNAAINAGYLERVEGSGSGAKLVRPTRAGAAAYEHDGLLRATIIRSVLDGLGPGRARSLIAGLKDFNDAWDAALARRVSDARR